MLHRHSFDVEDSQDILKDDVTMIASIDNLKVKSNYEFFYYRKLNIRISQNVLCQFIKVIETERLYDLDTSFHVVDFKFYS